MYKRSGNIYLSCRLLIFNEIKKLSHVAEVHVCIELTHSQPKVATMVRSRLNPSLETTNSMR